MHVCVWVRACVYMRVCVCVRVRRGPALKSSWKEQGTPVLFSSFTGSPVFKGPSCPVSLCHWPTTPSHWPLLKWGGGSRCLERQEEAQHPLLPQPEQSPTHLPSLTQEQTHMESQNQDLPSPNPSQVTSHQLTLDFLPGIYGALSTGIC